LFHTPQRDIIENCRDMQAKSDRLLAPTEAKSASGVWANTANKSGQYFKLLASGE